MQDTINSIAINNSIITQLPKEINLPQAIRLKNFLLSWSHTLTKERKEIIIYGSGAIAFYIADENELAEFGFTSDIDVASNNKTPLDLYNFKTDELFIQPCNIETHLIHPEWESRLINFDYILNIQNLSIMLINPYDMVTLKIGRGLDDDFEDCIRIRTRYQLSAKTSEDILREAVKYYSPANDSYRLKNINDLFTDIFDHKPTSPFEY